MATVRIEPSRLGSPNFGYDAGWRPARHPRMLADLTGNGRNDVVGFGDAGVWIALDNGDRTFGSARLVTSEYGYDAGWRVFETIEPSTSTVIASQVSPYSIDASGDTRAHPRMLADLRGTGRADIVGFSEAGVMVALNLGSGTFATSKNGISRFGQNDGWRYYHPRHVLDLTGDGRADILGFGDMGVWVARGNGDGTFADFRMVLRAFGYVEGGWTQHHQRVLVDVTGDGRPDIVGFSDAGVMVAISSGDGTFQAPKMGVAHFGSASGGWLPSRHPRVLADVTGDGRPDIVGFADAGVVVSRNNGDGTFAEPRLVLGAFGYKAGGWLVEKHPRMLVDLTGDGRADIVGFADVGVMVALNNGDGTFASPQLLLGEFGAGSAGGGWKVDDHPRYLVSSDGRAGILGFAGAGVRVSTITVS